MNLYERLNPVIKKAIEKRSKLLPLTMEELIDELKNKDSIFLITYGSFIELEYIVRFYTDINPNNSLEYFVK